jgi:hypothetical protein
VHKPVPRVDPLVEYEIGWVGSDDPAEVLAETPALLRAAIRAVDAETLRRRPAPDSWSAMELLGHFVDIELIHAERFRRILAEDKPRLVPFDPEAWNTTLGHSKRSPEEHLAAFEALRKSNLDVWRRASPAERVREYIHGQRGVETYELLFKMCAGHDRLHLVQLREAIEAGRGAGAVA